MKKYINRMKIAHRKSVYIDSKDPRAKSRFNLEKYRSRLGSKPEIVENSEIFLTDKKENTCFFLYTDTQDEKISNYPIDVYNIYPLLEDGTYLEGRWEFSKLDSEENIVCCGLSNVKANKSKDPYYNIILEKFDKKGNALWQVIIDHDITLSIKDMRIDKDNNIYILGTRQIVTEEEDNWHIIDYDDGLSYKETIILKYSESGQKIWSKNLKVTFEDIPAGFTYYAGTTPESHIEFDELNENLYILISIDFYTKAPVGYIGRYNNYLYFQIYELDCSSGNISRRTSPYKFITIGPPSSDRTVIPNSICYAENYLYVFGPRRLLGSSPYYSDYMMMKVDLSTFEFLDTNTKILYVGCEETIKAVFDKESQKIFFISQEEYTSYGPVFYQIDTTNDSILRKELDTSSFFLNSGIALDSNGDILISGRLTYGSGSILRYSPSKNIIKYFNIDLPFISINEYSSFSISSSRAVLSSSLTEIYNMVLINIPLKNPTVKNNIRLPRPLFSNNPGFSYNSKLLEGIDILTQSISKVDGPDLDEAHSFFIETVIYSIEDFSYFNSKEENFFTYIKTEF